MLIELNDEVYNSSLIQKMKKTQFWILSNKGKEFMYSIYKKAGSYILGRPELYGLTDEEIRFMDYRNKILEDRMEDSECYSLEFLKDYFQRKYKIEVYISLSDKPIVLYFNAEEERDNKYNEIINLVNREETNVNRTK